jgi:HK97 family phage major capsid protein/HK97 family phage prohead protease
MNRAYAILDVKSVDEEKRTIRGVATTPTPDRVEDIIEPLGVEFSNPLPLLWQHQSEKPVGTTELSKPTKSGVGFLAQLPFPTVSENLIARVSEAWESVKLGLVRAVSIGFRPLEYSFMENGGIRYTRIEVLELSLVTIPANVDATIQSIKSIDAPRLAATGKEPKASDRPTPPASGKKSNPIVKAQEGKTMKKTIAEQISAFQSTRQIKHDRMTAIMDESGESGETLDSAKQQEYDTLKDEVKSIDDHLVRLADMEKLNITRATAVERVAGHTQAAEVRSGVRVENVRANVQKGIAFARVAMALGVSKGNYMQAYEMAKANSAWENTPEVLTVLKTAVAAGSMTNMSALGEATFMASEFIEYLWPRTIIGRITGLRRVPFNIKVPRQTAVASVGWVGEGNAKPVSKGAFDTVTLGNTKIAGIVALTEELVRFSNPASETLTRDELSNAIIKLMDKDFLDPEKAAVANTSPASITYGVTPVSATGTAYANFVADFASAMDGFDAAEVDTADVVVVTRSRQARKLGLMLNSLGQPLFPKLGAKGGEMQGMEVITSTNVDYTEDSPQEGDNIIFIKPSDIFLADDGQVTIDVSREASIQMNDAPDNPTSASTVMVSLWQNNLVGIRAERFINWLKRRDAAVQYIKAAKYA